MVQHGPGDNPQSAYEFLTGESQVETKIEHYREPLRHVALLANMRDADLDLIARLVSEVTVEPNDLILEQGTEGRGLVFIRSGRVRVELNGDVIAHLEEGDYVGELSLIDGKTHSASVYADAPCELLVIQKHTFDHVLNSNPQIKDTLLVTLCSRLRELHKEIVHRH